MLRSLQAALTREKELAQRGVARRVSLAKVIQGWRRQAMDSGFCLGNLMESDVFHELDDHDDLQLLWCFSRLFSTNGYTWIYYNVAIRSSVFDRSEVLRATKTVGQREGEIKDLEEQLQANAQRVGFEQLGRLLCGC